MKDRSYLPPLSHSNLSAEENLASRFDPNGSYTGVPSDSHPVPSSIDETAPHTQPLDDPASPDRPIRQTPVGDPHREPSRPDDGKIRYKSAATPSEEGYVHAATQDGSTSATLDPTPDGTPDLTYSEDAILPDCPMPEGWHASGASFAPAANAQQDSAHDKGYARNAARSQKEGYQKWDDENSDMSPYGKQGRSFSGEPSIPDGELPLNLSSRPAAPVQDVDDL